MSSSSKVDNKNSPSENNSLSSGDKRSHSSKKASDDRSLNSQKLEMRDMPN